MKIGILTPDKKFDDFLRKTVLEYGDRKCLSVELEPFPSLKDVLLTEQPYDLLLIDDKYEHRSCVETARLIRTKNPAATMVLISSSPDKVYESFAVRAHRYLLKPVTQTMLFEALDSYFNERMKNFLVICRTHTGFMTVPSEDILYVEANQKDSILHLRTGPTGVLTSFSQVVLQVPPESFCQTHRSYMVNMKYIARFDPDFIYLTNGSKIALSRRRKVTFLVAYNEYIRRRNTK